MELDTAPAAENQLDRLRLLADKLDCLLETDVMLVAKASSATVEAWRKRGTGPEYILLGNRYLYPRESFAKYLSTKVRDRNTDAGKALL